MLTLIISFINTTRGNSCGSGETSKISKQEDILLELQCQKNKVPMKKGLIISISLFLAFISCTKNKENSVKNKPKKELIQQRKRPKDKVGKGNNLTKTKKRTAEWFLALDFNIEKIKNKNSPLQKHFSEYLGLGLKLFNQAKRGAERQQIKNKLQKIYDYTLLKYFHNLDSLDAKNFKKNSMSYLRILYLLEELGFDVTYYKTELKKVKSKIDYHLKLRGDWQKCAFENYYNYFKLKKPTIISNTQNYKGILNNKLNANQYTLSQAYELTHFVFIAFEYGAKKTQSKFGMEDLNYLYAVLPKLAKTYQLKNNRDILAELVTCMKMLNVNDLALDNAVTYLLKNQNNDGTWGNYERARKKYGDLVEVKLYLHTALVAYEALTINSKTNSSSTTQKD